MNIAVLELSANGVSQADAKAVTMLLQSELAANKSFRVIERGTMDAVLKEQEFAATGCTESSCAVKIGKMLNVRSMVYGSVSKLGESYFIAVNVVDVESTAVIGTAKAKVKKLDDADDAAHDIVTALAEKRSVTTHSGVKIDIAMPDIGAAVSNAMSIAEKTHDNMQKISATRTVKSNNTLVPHPGYAIWPVDIGIAYPLSVTGLERRATIVFVSLGLITTYAARHYGVKMSGIVGIVEEDFIGLTMSVIGNEIKENASGLAMSVIFNTAGTGTIFGQLGLVNICQEGNLALQLGLINTSGSMRGIQMGLVNVADKNMTGLQIGLVNVAGRFGGVQLGLVNTSREGGLPFLPIINIGIAF